MEKLLTTQLEAEQSHNRDGRRGTDYLCCGVCAAAEVPSEPCKVDIQRQKTQRGQTVQRSHVGEQEEGTREG